MAARGSSSAFEIAPYPHITLHFSGPPVLWLFRLAGLFLFGGCSPTRPFKQILYHWQCFQTGLKKMKKK